MNANEIVTLAEALVSDGHGWLMTDGECATIREAIEVQQTELAEAQRRERALLSGIEKYCGKIQQNCIRLQVELKGETHE